MLSFNFRSKHAPNLIDPICIGGSVVCRQKVDEETDVLFRGWLADWFYCVILSICLPLKKMIAIWTRFQQAVIVLVEGGCEDFPTPRILSYYTKASIPVNVFILDSLNVQFEINLAALRRSLSYYFKDIRDSLKNSR